MIHYNVGGTATRMPERIGFHMSRRRNSQSNRILGLNIVLDIIMWCRMNGIIMSGVDVVSRKMFHNSNPRVIFRKIRREYIHVG